MNIIGFAYSIAQAFDLIHQFVKGKTFVLSRLRLYIDFAIDQASHLTLHLSASNLISVITQIMILSLLSVYSLVF